MCVWATVSRSGCCWCEWEWRKSIKKLIYEKKEAEQSGKSNKSCFAVMSAAIQILAWKVHTYHHIQQKSFAPKIWQNSRLFMKNSFGTHRHRPTDPFEIFKFSSHSELQIWVGGIFRKFRRAFPAIFIASFLAAATHIVIICRRIFPIEFSVLRYARNSEEATHKLEIIPRDVSKAARNVWRENVGKFSRAHANCEEYACRLCGGGWSAEFSCKPQQLQTFAR